MFNPINTLIANTVGSNTWNDGICGCCANPAMCCQMCCCYCCTVSNMANFITFKDPSCNWGDCFLVMTADYYTGCVSTMMTGLGIRRQMIQRYGIRNESYCESCCLSCCCCPCNWCQVQHEMEVRVEYAGGCCYIDPLQAVTGGAVQQLAGAARQGMGMLGDVAKGKLPSMPGQWNSTVCDCTCAECCEGMCCCCCVNGFITKRISRDLEDAGDGQEGIDIGGCCMTCWLWAGGTLAVRREILQKYNIINEPLFISWVYSTVCFPWASLQVRREMGYRGEWPGGICQSEPRDPPNILTALLGQ